MSYDEAIVQVEAIVKDLEKSEALSMEVYKQKAQKAKELLDFCEKQLGVMAESLTPAHA